MKFQGGADAQLQSISGEGVRWGKRLTVLLCANIYSLLPHSMKWKTVQTARTARIKIDPTFRRVEPVFCVLVELLATSVAPTIARITATVKTKRITRIILG